MTNDAFSLQGRVAVVTGGTRGLGKAFTHALASAGADVGLLSRHADEAKAAADDVRGLGVRAFGTGADVTSRTDIERARREFESELGPVDVLVNNAGICIHKDALDVTDDEWRSVLAVNLDGVWICSQVFGASMVARRSGSIVNIGSMSGLIVNRPQNQPAYNASKAAVHHLTKSLAAEWAPYGVRVNALAPGYVRTEMSPVDRSELRRMWIEDAPMQRVAMPDELGPPLVFLASDASSFVTGSILIADGGYTVF
jgi:NAD(P)-dependent dehydrogenase (short-subunit alcohol dehydrogenase family)